MREREGRDGVLAVSRQERREDKVSRSFILRILDLKFCSEMLLMTPLSTAAVLLLFVIVAPH